MASRVSSSKLLKRMHRALDRVELVDISRGIRGADELDGYVVGIGAQWMLLALLADSVGLNGWAALRVADVTKVRRKAESEQFYRRALETKGEWPPTCPPGVSLDNTRSLVVAASERFPLVSFFIEREDPDRCWIGKPVGVSQRSVKLHEVTPQAEWELPPTKWKFADLSRVDFDAGYERMLWQLAGPPAEDQPDPVHADSNR